MGLERQRSCSSSLARSRQGPLCRRHIWVFPLCFRVRPGAPEPQHLHTMWVIVPIQLPGYCVILGMSPLLLDPGSSFRPPTKWQTRLCPIFPESRPLPRPPLLPALLTSIVLVPVGSSHIYIFPCLHMEAPHGIILFMTLSPESSTVPGT